MSYTEVAILSLIREKVSPEHFSSIVEAYEKAVNVDDARINYTLDSLYSEAVENAPYNLVTLVEDAIKDVLKDYLMNFQIHLYNDVVIPIHMYTALVTTVDGIPDYTEIETIVDICVNGEIDEIEKLGELSKLFTDYGWEDYAEYVESVSEDFFNRIVEVLNDEDIGSPIYEEEIPPFILNRFRAYVATILKDNTEAVDVIKSIFNEGYGIGLDVDTYMQHFHLIRNDIPSKIYPFYWTAALLLSRTPLDQIDTKLRQTVSEYAETFIESNSYYGILSSTFEWLKTYKED